MERSSSGIQAIEYRPGTPHLGRGRRAGEEPAVVAGRRSLDGNRMRRTPSGGSGSPASCTGSGHVSGSDARGGLANTSGSGGAGRTAAASAVRDRSFPLKACDLVAATRAASPASALAGGASSTAGSLLGPFGSGRWQRDSGLGLEARSRPAE